jgi:hypothetical protein
MVKHLKIIRDIILAIFGGYIGAIFGFYASGIPTHISYLIIILSGMLYGVIWIIDCIPEKFKGS